MQEARKQPRLGQWALRVHHLGASDFCEQCPPRESSAGALLTSRRTRGRQSFFLALRNPPPPPHNRPGTSPQSHDASGWGNSKMGTLSRWHHGRVSHLSPFFEPAPFHPQPTDSGHPTHLSTRGGFPPQKVTCRYTWKCQLAYSHTLFGTRPPADCPGLSSHIFRVQASDVCRGSGRRASAGSGQWLHVEREPTPATGA